MGSNFLCEKGGNHYKFDIGLTKRIRKYHNAEWCEGNLVRWLLQDKSGNSVHCDQCGNIANFVKLEIHGRYRLHVPICKRHAEELYALNAGWTYRDLWIVQEGQPEEQFYVAWDGTRRRWRYLDIDRPRNADGELSAECYDCQLPYDAIGDCSIPNDVWEKINPTYHKGAGILCPNCILQRLHHLDISGVKATLW